MASLTLDNAPALDPGEAEGVDMGEDPIGGLPESEGGIIGIVRVTVLYRLCLRRRRLRSSIVFLLLRPGGHFTTRTRVGYLRL